MTSDSTFSVDIGHNVDGSSIIGNQHFGGAYTTYFGLSSFDQAVEALGVHHVRWPGGTRGEMHFDTNDADGDGVFDEYLYSLTNENVLTVPGKGLSDILAYAGSKSMAFTMFTPVERYVGNPEQANQDVRAFITKLLKGADGGFGELPSEFTLEIGNESVGQGVADAAEYGVIANSQIAAVREVLANEELNPFGYDIKIAIQMGQSNDEDVAIRSEIDPVNLSAIDAVINHHLPLNIVTQNKAAVSTSPMDFGDSNFDRFSDYVAQWEAAVGEAQGNAKANLNYYVSEWTVGEAGALEAGELEFQDYGARQGRTVIDTFSQFVGAGADSAALWGIDARPNANWFSTLEDSEVRLSHGGEIYRLMSESLIGTNLLQGYDQPVPQYLSGAFSPYWIYAYESDAKVVLFLAANDLSGPLEVAIDLGSISGVEDAQVVRVGTELDPTFNGEPNSIEARLHELPVVEYGTTQFINHQIEYTFTQDYEVARIIIEKTESVSIPDPIQLSGSRRSDKLSTGDGDDVINGKGGHDKIRAMAGQDDLSGGNGRDRLFGGSGDDQLSGSRGKDRLFGQDGDDLLSGGQGRDTFIFKSGDDKDTISDFNAKQDTLRFNGVSSNDVFLESDGHDTVVHYGENDSVTLLDITGLELDDGVFVFG